MKSLRFCSKLLLTGLCLGWSSLGPVWSADDEQTPADATLPSTEPAAKSAVDPLGQKFEQITTRMSQAKSQLAERQTGQTTQDLQKQILADLDELLKTPPQSSDSPSGGGGSSSSSNSSSSPKPSPSNQQKSSSGQQPANQQSSGQQKSGQSADNAQDRENSEDSEERTGERKRGNVVELPRQRLEVDVWGHLPENVREKLLNAYGERMVPEYADLVQRFYRSLAETNSPRDRAPERNPR